MSNLTPLATDRYLTIVSLLQQILARLDDLERDVDQIDVTLRPHGDGTKIRPRRRR